MQKSSVQMAGGKCPDCGGDTISLLHTPKSWNALTDEQKRAVIEKAFQKVQKTQDPTASPEDECPITTTDSFENEEIEKYLGTQNMIESANVFLTLTGKLYIKIEQNIPLLRIYCRDGKEFYIDHNAEICNTVNGRAANVLIASGDINEKLELGQIIDSIKEPITHNVYKIAKNIVSRDILANQIDQIYYSKKNGFELLPKVGDYVISLGGTNDLDKKLNKLVYLYKEGFTKYGWDEYSYINLQFKNQAICTKK